MVTSARRCAGCGSPLPETPPGTRQLTCAFCGLVNDLKSGGHDAQTPPPVTITVDVGRAAHAAASAGRTIAWVVLLVVAVSLASVGVAIYMAVRSTGEVITTVRSQVPPPVAPRTAKIAPAGLNALGEVGWRELDVPAPTSGWSAFEPVTDLRWAYAIARAWQPDARLTRIDADRVAESGTIDLTAGPDNTAGYRFVSPGQIENWGRLADRDSRAKVGYELMVKLAEQKTTALIVSGQPRAEDLPPVDLDTHPLPELLRLARKGKGFIEHPFYKGYLIHLQREGWVWYFQSLSGREPLPRVRARDGAVYPYRR